MKVIITFYEDNTDDCVIEFQSEFGLDSFFNSLKTGFVPISFVKDRKKEFINRCDVKKITVIRV